MSKKILTVLICSKNGAPYIARCLDSLSKQTLDKSLWSILFVNHRSTDNSLEILNRLIKDDDASDFKLPEIKVLDLPEQVGGLAFAKNKGLSQIDTEFIGLADIDDLYFSQRLEKQLEIFQNGVNQQPEGYPYSVDICSTQAWDRLPDGRLMINCFKIGQYQWDNEIKSRLPIENCLMHSSIIFRKEVIDKLGGYSDTKECIGREDHDLWLRAAKYGFKFYNIPERLSIYSMGTSVER